MNHSSKTPQGRSEDRKTFVVVPVWVFLGFAPIANKVGMKQGHPKPVRYESNSVLKHFIPRLIPFLNERSNFIF